VRELWVDFNARTEDDRIRLDTEGSKESLRKLDAQAGDRFYLGDGEVRVVGVLDLDADGRWYACPDWKTLEDVEGRR
jgi:hypothetical protein